MTITTEAFGVRSVVVKGRSGRELAFHYHKGGYGPRITVRSGSDTAGFEISLDDAADLAKALTLMAEQ